MKTTIVFSTSDSIVSKLVRIFTWSEWSHVDVMVSEHWVIGSVPGIGVIMRPASEVTRGKHAMRQVDIDPKVLTDLMMLEIGKAYDWMGIIGFVFRKEWQREKKWFCSELVAAKCDQAGVKLFNDYQWRITPQSLFANPLLKEISDGQKAP